MEKGLKTVFLFLQWFILVDANTINHVTLEKKL